MKKLVGVLFLFLLAAAVAGGQDSEVLINAYKKTFDTGNLETKIELIRDLVSQGREDMGPLFIHALDHVMKNQTKLSAEGRLIFLASAALQGVGETGYAKGNRLLLRLFAAEAHTLLRVPILEVLGKTAKGDSIAVEQLNAFLDSTNASFEAGQEPDMLVVIACVQTLGQLGDDSSFPILFNVMNLGNYNNRVREYAEQSLLLFESDLKELLSRIIDKGSNLEKKNALRYAQQADRLTDNDKTEIAEFALLSMLRLKVPKTSDLNVYELRRARELRYSAALTLSQRGWSRLPGLAIEHFEQTLAEYEQGVAPKNHLMEAIDFLGNTGAPEAVSRLVRFLEYFSKIVEEGHAADEQIVLSLMGNIVKLDDKSAIDKFLTVQYLNFSPAVKAAARESVRKLLR